MSISQLHISCGPCSRILTCGLLGTHCYVVSLLLEARKFGFLTLELKYVFVVVN